MKRREILGADLFCGAGGTSQGLLMAANKLNADLKLLAVNHWQVAIDTHKLNHPEAQNLCTGVDVVDPLKIVPGGRLDLLCASPECTHHSVARGGRPMNDQSRASAWHIARWAQVLYIKALIIENVPEFVSWGPLGSDGRPMKSKRGALFNQFIDTLKALGYKVEWKVLNCADYGAPTTRRRLFIMARRDGRKISWPEPTHVRPSNKKQSGLFAESRPNWRTAREIIDWTLTSKDIFDRKKPLADNTLRRIQAGMKEFNGIHLNLKKCIEEGLRPYLVVLRGTGTTASVDDPLQSVTAGGNHYGLVQPFLLPHRTSANMNADDLADPLRTVTAHSADFCLIEPFTMQIDQTSGNGAVRSTDEPVATLVTKANTCVVEPFFLPHRTKDPNVSVDIPFHTVTATSNDFALCEPFLTAAGGTEGQGRNPHSVDEAIGTVLTNDRRAICEPFLAVLRGKSSTSPADAPVPTVTNSGAHYASIEPFIVPQFGGAAPRSVDRPAGTVTTTSRGVGLAESFLVPNFGERVGQKPRTHSLEDPAPAVTSHGAGGLVSLEPSIVTVTHSGGERHRSVDVPMATVTSSMGDGVTEPYLVEYFGTGNTASVDNPLEAVTTKPRNALVIPQLVAEGHLVYRLEIRFRMLQPRELARAQGFPDAYQFTGNREAVVKQIGNAVPPPMMEALAGAVLS